MLEVPFPDWWLSNTFKAKTFDDAVDRLSYVTTVTLLTFFSIMASCKQYAGSAIQCWMPMEFKSGWEEYAESYCYAKNTFFIPELSEIPVDVEDRQKAEIGYYQWVPIVLAIQAFMFYLPSLIWPVIYKHFGHDFSSVISEAKALRSKDSETRKKGIADLVGFIEDILETRSKNEYSRFHNSRTHLLYICLKFVYFANVSFQFIFLNKFIGNQYFLWGFNTIAAISAGHGCQDSGVFPRFTLCGFNVQSLGIVENYQVKCVLLSNMLNEKMYLCLWTWFMFMLIITFVNTLCTIYRLFPGACETYVESILVHEKWNDSSRSVLKKFAEQGLKQDGVLLMRFIDDEAGDGVATEICEILFSGYYKTRLTARFASPT